MATDPIYTVKKLLALEPQMTERISEYRFQQRIGSENEAMRRLIGIGLNGGAKPQQHAQPRPLRALLVEYYQAVLAAEPGIELDGTTGGPRRD